MPPFGVRFKLEAVDKGNKPDEKSACRGHGEPRMQADFVLWGPGLGLRLLKNTILSTDPCCRKVLSFAEKKRRECFYNLILPFCPITFLTQPSAPYFSSLAARTSPCGHGLLCRSCIKLDGHSVFKSGASPDDIFENKRRITIIRPITENVPYGRSNRNPSNIMNILDFLNVRMQCNIRGAESQGSAGGEI